MLRVPALLLALTAGAFAVDVSTLQPQGYVSDFARVIDPVARQDVERYCARIQKSTGVQMAFVTLSTLGGDPVEQFANDLFRRWGIGAKGKDEGLLLLLVINDRRSRLEVGRGLEPYITDGTAGTLLRSMSPALKAGRYAEALGTAAHELGERVAKAKNVSISEAEPPRARVREEPASIPFYLIWGGLLLLFVFGSRRTVRRRYGYGGGGGFLPGLILGSMMNRPTYGGHGHGGFGGYDSSDTFSGFGGGDSGGGGASSSW
ncbi:MAG TPA: TPM domain-containing protein [Bryobacteraceae bacterium]|nr:TPM domain-containing protein [Bryobacteraceae bacterium]